MQRWIWIALVFCLTASPLWAEVPLAFEGRRLFNSYCFLCHGLDGKGGGPLAYKMKITPADLTQTVRVRSDLLLTKIISGEGRQTITGRDRHNLISDAMPEWSKVLNQEQIKALVAYLRFISTSKNPLLGDPELGQRVYAKYCQVCHGEEGGGDGPMTKIMPIKPKDHSNPNQMNSLSNQQLVQHILEGMGPESFMPAWQGILNKDEVEAVVSYIRLLSL